MTLTTIDLSANRIKSLNSLRPMTLCSSLCQIHVKGNPFLEQTPSFWKPENKKNKKYNWHPQISDFIHTLTSIDGMPLTLKGKKEYRKRNSPDTPSTAAATPKKNSPFPSPLPTQLRAALSPKLQFQSPKIVQKSQKELDNERYKRHHDFLEWLEKRQKQKEEKELEQISIMTIHKEKINLEDAARAVRRLSVFTSPMSRPPFDPISPLLSATASGRRHSMIARVGPSSAPASAQNRAYTPQYSLRQIPQSTLTQTNGQIQESSEVRQAMIEDFLDDGLSRPSSRLSTSAPASAWTPLAPTLQVEGNIEVFSGGIMRHIDDSVPVVDTARLANESYEHTNNTSFLGDSQQAEQSHLNSFQSFRSITQDSIESNFSEDFNSDPPLSTRNVPSSASVLSNSNESINESSSTSNTSKEFDDFASASKAKLRSSPSSAFSRRVSFPGMFPSTIPSTVPDTILYPSVQAISSPESFTSIATNFSMQSSVNTNKPQFAYPFTDTALAQMTHIRPTADSGAAEGDLSRSYAARERLKMRLAMNKDPGTR